LLTRTEPDWDKKSSFDGFLKSEEIKAYVGQLKTFAAGPSVLELFEADQESLPCTSSNFTQVIKARFSPSTEDAWKQLEIKLSKASASKLSFHYAKGIEKVDGMFLGLIGWNDIQVSESRWFVDLY
jgi:hypothetical protein